MKTYTYSFHLEIDFELLAKIVGIFKVFLLLYHSDDEKFGNSQKVTHWGNLFMPVVS